jgi:hypothetical protein
MNTMYTTQCTILVTDPNDNTCPVIEELDLRNSQLEKAIVKLKNIRNNMASYTDDTEEYAISLY